MKVLNPVKAPISSEDKDALFEHFMLLCLRGRFEPAALETAREWTVQHPVDWDYGIKRIISENLAPLFYATLKGRNILPEAVEKEFNEVYTATRVYNTVLFDSVREILRRLEAARIPVILLKGAALACWVYKDHAVRPCLDADLLVPWEHARQALKELQALGYEMPRVESAEGFHLQFENEVSLSRSDAVETVIELHWGLIDSLFYQNKIHMDWFWRTLRPLDFYGQPAQMLGLEAQLIHLCAHVMLHHNGKGKFWLHDIAEILWRYNGQVDWDLILQQAAAFDLVLPLQTVLAQVVAGWGAPVPQDVLQKLSALQATDKEQQVYAFLTSHERTVGRRFIDDLFHTPDWKSRLQFARNSLLPSAHYMIVRYQIPHPILIPLYYPYRWLIGVFSLFRSGS